MGIVIAELLPILLEVLAKAPGVIESVRQIWTLATQTTAPTPEEQKTFDDALDAAHKALQES